MSFLGESRVILLFAAFGDEHHREALEWLRALSDRVFDHGFSEVFQAKNRQIGNEKEDPSFLVGDNFAADFSAWASAVAAYKKSTRRNDDILVFANDSFHRNFGTGILRHFFEFPLAQWERGLQEGIVGIVDDFPKPVEVCGLHGQKWIRSNLFFLQARNLEKIEPLCLSQETAKLIFSEEKGFFRTKAPLSANYQAYMLRWLFGTASSLYPEYQIEWFKAQALDEQNRADFQRKMRAILSEHGMSFRAQANGLRLANVNPLPWDADRHTRDIYERHRLLYPPIKLSDLKNQKRDASL